MNYLKFSALLFVVLTLDRHASAADSWSQWRGPERSGTTQVQGQLMERLPADGLEPMWIADDQVLAGGGWASPVVADDRVYLYSHGEIRKPDVQLPEPQYPPLSEDEEKRLTPQALTEYERHRSAESMERRRQMYEFIDRISCFDAATGQTVWSQTAPTAATRWRHSSTPLVAGDDLYFLSADYHLCCWSTSDGSQRWKSELPIEVPDDSPVSSSPLLIDGVIIVVARDILAYSATGELLWQTKYDQRGAIHSSPVAWNRNGKSYVIANVSDVGTVCVAAIDGQELWRVDSLAGRSTPVVSGEYLVTYGSSRKGGVRGYRLGEGAPEHLWTYTRMTDSGSSPVVCQDRVFVQGEDRFACLDLGSGDELWRTELDLDRPRYTSPIAAGDQIFYTFDRVACIDASAADYQPLYVARILTDGRLMPLDRQASETLTPEERLAASAQAASAGGDNPPRDCVSPALADGKLILRLEKQLVCYDLRQ